MRKTLFALVLLVLCPAFLVAQDALTNDSVVKMLKAGLSEDLVISAINSKPGTYDTSVDGMIALKGAGASDKVISAVVLKSSGSATQAPVAGGPAAPAATDPDDPASPHDAGIYIFSTKAPVGSKMTMLEPSIYSQGKTGGVFASAMTYGIAKVKMKAVLRGAHANARATDPQSTFYFYFEEQSAGLSHASSPIFGGTSTPNEYTLLKFDIKGDTRETIVGKFNAYGSSGGTDDKAVTAFTYVKLRPGVYKVTMNGPLQSGEYGFISGSGTASVSPYAGAAVSNSRVFDFGVN